MNENRSQYGQLNIDSALNDEHIYSGFLTVTDMVNEDVPPQSLYSHGYFEVEMVIEGSGTLCIDGKTIPCKINDVYVISPNLPHRYFSADKNEQLMIRRLIFRIEDWFKGDAQLSGNRHYCYGLFEDGASFSYAMLNFSMRERMDMIWDSIDCELHDRESEWKSVVRTYLVQMFVFLGRYINNSVRNTARKSKEQDILNAAIRIVEEEYSNSDTTLEIVAKRVFVSRSWLSRNFKLYTGNLFSDYLRDVRLKNAEELLVNTDMTVERIVFECGFRNVPTFYKNFRDTYGMTPQNYRELSKKTAEKININKNSESEGNRKMELLNEISANLQIGKAKIVKTLVQQAIDEGVPASDILEQGLLAGMSIVGEKFKNNEVYVPEVLVAARAMNMGAQILKPYLAEAGVTATGRVCLGTVQGDLHDIGKNLVKMMMEGKGLEVVDLGTDVSPEAFVNTAIEQNCQVICCSALLTTTMPVMADVVKLAEEKGIRDKVKIMVGGAPVSQEYCDKIGADCYTVDAASAADAAVELCRA